MKISQEELKEVLEYDPETGKFYWTLSKKVASNMRGWEAGSLNDKGYIKIKIKGHTYNASQLAYIYMTGELPIQIDHINRNKSDNSWTNLRQATDSQNQFNKNLPSNNKSGFKGVIWYKRTNRWNAYITINKLRHNLGYFNRLEDAVEARRKAELHYFGEYS